MLQWRVDESELLGEWARIMIDRKVVCEVTSGKDVIKKNQITHERADTQTHTAQKVFYCFT